MSMVAKLCREVTYDKVLPPSYYSTPTVTTIVTYCQTLPPFKAT